MTPVLFAQAVGEYGGASGFGSGLVRVWSDVTLAIRDMETSTWLAVGGAAIVVLLFLRGRR